MLLQSSDRRCQHFIMRISNAHELGACQVQCRKRYARAVMLMCDWSTVHLRVWHRRPICQDNFSGLCTRETDLQTRSPRT